MRTTLTIAGSDPSGGAGIQADLKTFAAHGVYGVSVVTAVTVQSTLGVECVEAMPADLVTAQIEAVAADIGIDAVKTGMLGTAAVVEAVTAAIDEMELPLVVVDPVLVATSGLPLLDADGIRALTSELLRRARVATPNIPEAEMLCGRRIESLADARDAARRIRDLGPRAVIVTGGHASFGADVVDVLIDDGDIHELTVPRVDSAGAHGTGCTFAAAVAAGLAAGEPLVDAAAAAQTYVAGALRHAISPGRGRAVLHHFWRMHW